MMKLAALVASGAVSAAVLGQSPQPESLRASLSFHASFDGIAVLLRHALIVVALTACMLPARRATRLDPLAALRCD